MQAINPPPKLPTLTVGEWTTSWVARPSSAKLVDLTKLYEILLPLQIKPFL